MPIIRSITVGVCGEEPSTELSGRYVTYIVDSVGDGSLDYSTNNGVVPGDLTKNLEVYQNGNRLDYPEQYTVTEFGVDSTTTRIQIISPLLGPPAYYAIIAYH